MRLYSARTWDCWRPLEPSAEGLEAAGFSSAPGAHGVKPPWDYSLPCTSGPHGGDHVPAWKGIAQGSGILVRLPQKLSSAAVALIGRVDGDGLGPRGELMALEALYHRPRP